LRELEGLARRDVVAWWLCGGHQPDHSTIGKFIVLHSEVLTDEFFVTLVKHLVARMRLGPTLTAGDGTIIEAAACRFRLLRVEAAQQAAQELAAQAQRRQMMLSSSARQSWCGLRRDWRQRRTR
jgi:hypothetical protein